MQNNSANTQKILFIINPVSGEIDKTGFKNLVNSDKYSHIIPESYMTTGKNDIERIEDIIHRNTFDKLCAVGGDGTFNLVARVSLNTKIPMGYVPMGTANGMAMELRIPNNLHRALGILIRGKKQPLDILRINQKHISVHYSDIGANARVMKRFERERKGGFRGYIKQYFKEIMQLEKTHFSVSIDEDKTYKKTTMVILANASMLGTGAVINPLGSSNDGKFEVIILKRFPKWFFLVIIAYSLFGNLNKLKYIKTIQCERVSVTTHKKQQLQIDGEPIDDVNKVSAEIIPGGIHVICPPLR